MKLASSVTPLFNTAKLFWNKLCCLKHDLICIYKSNWSKMTCFWKHISHCIWYEPEKPITVVVCVCVQNMCFSLSVSDAVMPSSFSPVHSATDQRQGRANAFSLCVCMWERERETRVFVSFIDKVWTWATLPQLFPTLPSQPNTHTSPHLGTTDIYAKSQHTHTHTHPLELYWQQNSARRWTDVVLTSTNLKTHRHKGSGGKERKMRGKRERGRRGVRSSLLQLAGMPKPAGRIKAHRAAEFINGPKYAGV